MKENKIKSISELIEKPEKRTVGFTVTYEDGKVHNFYILGDDYEQYEEIQKIKMKYNKYKKMIK